MSSSFYFNKWKRIRWAVHVALNGRDKIGIQKYGEIFDGRRTLRRYRRAW
jgi:hypothetical protein